MSTSTLNVIIREAQEIIGKALTAFVVAWSFHHCPH